MIKVLVTNDDGIDAAGIKLLAEALAPMADVYVFAPKNEQSGKSQSITFMRPVDVEKRDIKGTAAAYAVDGTPTDCVKVGLCMLNEEGIRPDYVFSGINLGYNSGLAAYYSGTVAAAREGALNGIRSIALSAGAHNATEFEYMLGMLPMLMEMADRTSPDVLLSVNVPNLPPSAIKGYLVLEAAPFGYGLNFIFEKVSEDCYQMTGEPARVGDGIKYDFDANEAGYAAISPIPTSMSDSVSLSRLQNAYAADKLLTAIVDAQEDIVEYLEDYSLGIKLSALTRCMSRMDMPVLLTMQYGKGDIIRSVKEYASRSETVERMQTDPWRAKDMEKFTNLVEAKRVIVAGAETHTSLLQTALGFVERGYDVSVIEDCCASEDVSDHKRALKELSEKGCRITALETEMMKIADDKDGFIRSSIEKILRKSRPIR